MRLRSVTARFLIPTILLLLVLGALVGTQITRTEKNVIEERAHDQAQAALEEVQMGLKLTDRMMHERVRAGAGVLRALAAERGTPRRRGTAVVAGRQVPDIYLGSEPQANNPALVDELVGLLGGTATVFVRSGSDYVRITTNVRKADGSRAVGTLLNPEGKAYAAISRGEAYRGVAGILGKQFITSYEPIIDAQGETIGIWYVGYEMAAMEDLAAAIGSRRVLTSGFVALQDDSGEVLFHSTGADPGSVEQVLRGENQAEWVVAEEAYEAWGYRVAAAYPESEVQAAVREALFMIVLVCLLGTMGAIGVLAFVVDRVVRRPVGELAEAAERVAAGDLDVRVAAHDRDELGQLGRGFNEMVDKIRDALAVAEERGESAEAALAQVRAAQQEADAQAAYRAEVSSVLARGIHRLAEGDLTAQLPMEALRTEEDRTLYDAFNKATTSVRDMLVRVGAAVEETASATSEISATSDQLAASSQEQSSQADEVAAAVEQMTRTIIENSRGTRVTAEAAEEGERHARDGGAVVEQTIAKIREIADVVGASADRVEQLGASSKKIGDIIQTIEDIADQTNLLALNAAIEAARAGEQGRGFAVVADEVRKLAERTAQATGEITGMIAQVQSETEGAVAAMQQGTQRVEEGLALADQTGQALRDIVASTERIGDRVAHIASASEEQSATSEQISQSVQSISAVSQESAVGVTQIARAADGLERLTIDLRAMIGQFHLEAEAERAAAGLSEGDGQRGALPSW